MCEKDLRHALWVSDHLRIGVSMHDAPPPALEAKNLCHTQLLDHRSPVHGALESYGFAQDDVGKVLPDVSGDHLMGARPFNANTKQRRRITFSRESELVQLRSGRLDG